MTELEERLTNEYSKLAEQYAKEQKQLRAQVEQLAEQVQQLAGQHANPISSGLSSGAKPWGSG